MQLQQINNKKKSNIIKNHDKFMSIFFIIIYKLLFNLYYENCFVFVKLRNSVWLHIKVCIAKKVNGHDCFFFFLQKKFFVLYIEAPKIVYIKVKFYNVFAYGREQKSQISYLKRKKKEKNKKLSEFKFYFT